MSGRLLFRIERTATAVTLANWHFTNYPNQPLPDYHPGDDFSPPTMAPRSAFSFVSGRGAARFRGAIGRVGNIRHDASTANHASALDLGAAGFPQRVSRVRPAWPGRTS